MNLYNIYEKGNWPQIDFTAIAKNSTQVKKLADEKDILIKGMVIELEWQNVKSESGNDLTACINSINDNCKRRNEKVEF